MSSGITITNNSFWIAPEYQAKLDRVFPLVESGIPSKDAWELAENEAIAKPNWIERNILGYKKASIVIREMSQGGYVLHSGKTVDTPSRLQYVCEDPNYEIFFLGDKPLCRKR